MKNAFNLENGSKKGSELNLAINTAIKNAFKNSNYSKKDLAGLLEVSRQTLHSKLTGQTRWKTIELKTIFDTLGIAYYTNDIPEASSPPMRFRTIGELVSSITQMPEEHIDSLLQISERLAEEEIDSIITILSGEDSTMIAELNQCAALLITQKQIETPEPERKKDISREPA